MTDLSGAILLPDGCRVRGRGRLRRWHRPYDGARNLVDAALETGAERFVQESIAFIYPDRGDAWIDEDVPIDPPALGRANQAAEAEAARFTGTGRAVWCCASGSSTPGSPRTPGTCGGWHDAGFPPCPDPSRRTLRRSPPTTTRPTSEAS
jgi:hypothetical protein